MLDRTVVEASDQRAAGAGHGGATGRTAAQLMHAAELVYRQVDGRFFVTNPALRRVVVLNESGFTVLRLCHERTMSDVVAAVAAEPETVAVDAAEVESFVHELQDNGLVKQAREVSREERIGSDGKAED